MKLKQVLFVWFIAAGLLVLTSKTAMASCADDPECGVPGYNCDSYGPDYHCMAYCCEPDLDPPPPEPTDPPPDGSTPPPGWTPPPGGTTYLSTWSFTFDNVKNNIFNSRCNVLRSLSDEYVIGGGLACSASCFYRTIAGITLTPTGGSAHPYNQRCFTEVPGSTVTMYSNPSLVNIFLPSGYYVVNASGNCSSIPGNSLQYSCPSGAQQHILLSNVSPACSISVTGPSSLQVGQTANLSVSKVGGGAITDVRVYSQTPNPTGVLTYSTNWVTWNGTPSPFTGLSVTGYSVGGVTVAVQGRDSATGFTCTASYGLTVTPALFPWWVTFGGDITAGNIIYSQMPAGYYLFNYTSLVASGIPIYQGDLNYGSGILSDTNRRANTNTYNLDTTYTTLLNKALKNRTPVTVTANPAALTNFTGYTPDSQGWEWYRATPGTGTLTLDTTLFAFASRKVVVFVDGNLVVNRNIQSLDGQGMPVFVVSGNITFNSSVANPTTLFEGAYYAGGDITFNSNGASSDPLLTVRAILVAGGSVVNNRDRGASNTSYAINYTRTPDLLFLLPSFMNSKRSLWREVAP